MIMKLRFTTLFVALSVFALAVSGCSKDDAKENPQDVVANVDDEVMACFDLLNQFRIGDEAHYLDKDNTTTISMVGQLQPLTLDPDLCKAAQIRANELLKNWSHTRPDGRDASTVLDDLGISVTAWGENIAAGNKGGAATFKQWKEDGKPYDGQGHRRNMLGKQFTKVGIAHAYDASTQYKHYWAMVLAR